MQEILEKIKATSRDAAPEAEEAINYQTPTFTLKGNLMYFAAFKKHIGFYPAPTGIEKSSSELAARLLVTLGLSEYAALRYRLWMYGSNQQLKRGSTITKTRNGRAEYAL